MARNLYGATSADFTLTSGGRVVPGATLTIWSARTGGTQITDLLDRDSVATTTVTSAADGSVVYFGPNNDKTVHWADAGQGGRIAIRPVDITGDPVPSISVNESLGYAIIVGGVGGSIEQVAARATLPISAHVEGASNTAQGWYAHAEGRGSIVEGKIGHAEGNSTICSGNDSHSEGNMNATGRRSFTPSATGSEDAGDSLGVLQYVTLSTTHGDVTSHFPNPLTDNVTSRYGAGAQKDAKGNIYHSSHTPAVWAGDILTTANDLQWALHPFAIVRGVDEADHAFIQIAKAVYSGGATKVYYLGAKPFTSITEVYGSYAPLLLDGGNGQHAEGYHTNATGYGAHSEGYLTRAWAAWGAHAEGRESQATGQAAHAEGWRTKASAESAHSEGNLTVASGLRAHAEGDETVASGQGSHSEGLSTTSSGVGSHAEGHSTTASGDYSHAEGRETQAIGNFSSASGYQSAAPNLYQQSYSVGKRSVVGDSQISRVGSGKSCADAGWHEVYVFLDVANNRTYLFETTVIGRQTGGSAGAVGNSFAYKFQGALTVDGSGNGTVIGTINRTLIGRTSGMTGDGLTTGPRMSQNASALYNNDIALRFDGEANTTFYINAYSTVQELA